MFFNTLLISIFSDACKIQSLLPFLAAFMFQKVFMMIPMAGLALKRRLLGNLVQSLRSVRGKAMVIWVVWMVLSVPFSIYPGASFAFITQNLWIKLVPFCLVIAYGESQESIDKMIWAFILAVAIFAVAAFVSHGLPRFHLIDEYDPNESALMFVMAFPLIFWKLMESQGVRKILLVCLSCLVVIGVIHTQSRGGFLGLIVVTAVSVWQYKRIRKVSIIKVALIVAVIIGILYVQGGSQYADRIKSIWDPNTDYNYSDKGGRLVIWKYAISMMLEHPVLGIGVDTFETGLAMSSRADDEEVWQAAHNSFLQVGSELGFPGLIAFCIIIFGSIKSLKKVISLQKEVISTQDASNRKPTLVISTAYSLIGCWTGFVVCGFFLSQAYRNLIFFLLSISFAFLNVANSTLKSNASNIELPDSQKAPQDIQYAGLISKNSRKYGRNRYLHI